MIRTPASHALRSWSLTLVLAGIGGGCSLTTSYDQQLAPVLAPYQSGDFEAAAQRIQDDYQSYWELEREAGGLDYERSAVIWNLERGKILLDAGRFAECFDALDDAEAIIKQDFDERAVVSARDVRDTLEASITNQRTRPYKGYIYDRVLLNVYKSLAALMDGDLEAALVEARRVNDNQRRALREFQDEADETAKASRERSLAFDYEGLLDSPGARQHFDYLRGADAYPPAYRDFVNPFATLVVGMLRRIKNHPAEDPEVDFRNLVSMLPESRYLAEELAAIRDRRGVGGTVYVLFENGLGPARYSQQVSVPYGFFQVLGGRSDHNVFNTAFFALPGLRPGLPAAKALIVESADGSEPRATEVVCDTFLMQLHELEHRLPTVILQEALRVWIQETGTHYLVKGVRDQDEALGDLLHFGTLLFKSAINLADDRGWRTLPANYQFARLERPAGGSLELRLLGGTASLRARLPEGDVVVMLVRSVDSDHLSYQAVGLSTPRLALNR